MKQKYHIWKNDKEKKLLIQEFAVLTANTGKQKLPAIQDEDFSLLCEQTYESADIKKASSEGKNELITLLRNQHFFPIAQYMDKIADAVIAMYASKDVQHEDLIFDDKEILALAAEAAAAVEEVEDQAADKPVDGDLDDLLKDNSGSAASNN